MNSKILLLLSIICINCYPQQTVKRITETNNDYIVELFVLRNGTNNCSLDGNEVFDWADGGWYYAYSTMTNNIITNYDHSATNFENQTNVTLPSIQLGNQTFNFSSLSLNTRYKSFNEGHAVYQGEILINYTPLINITTECYSGGGLGINTTFPKMFYGKLILKKTLNTGGMINNNLWIRFKTFDAYYNFNPSIQVGKTWYGKYDGSNWTEQNTDISGNPTTTIPTICSVLSDAEISEIDDRIIIYPNPIDNVMIIQKIRNTYDDFQYQIIDISGRILKVDNSNFGKEIDVSDLKSGNYFLKITNDSKTYYQKVIKK